MPIESREQELRAFLERISPSEEGAATTGADLFHEQFLNLDPSTVTVVTRVQLRAALPMRAGMFESIGAQGTRLRSLDTHDIDDQHVLVDTVWDVQFTDDVEPLALHSSYLLRRADSDWTIVAYINHQDIASIISARRAHSRSHE